MTHELLRQLLIRAVNASRDLPEAQPEAIAERVLAEKSPNPRRRVELTAEIGADSWEDAAHGLMTCAERVQEAARGNVIPGDRPRILVVSGGYSWGYILQGDEDPGITHGSWAEELEQVLAERHKGS